MTRFPSRWLTGAMVSAGLLLGSIGAADARPPRGAGGWNGGWNGDRGWNRGGGWDRRWDRGRHHRRGDGFGLGDAIGVAALVGAVAIVAGSISKDRQARDAGRNRADAPPPVAGTDYGADLGGRLETGRDDADFADVAGRDDAMTDACARAARDEAEQRYGGYAQVRHLETPLPTATGYNIDGYVESRSGMRADIGETRRFTCAIARDGRVADIYLARDLAAR